MSKKKIGLYALSILAFILLAGGISYGYFIYNQEVAVVEVTSGDINISFTTNNNALALSNLVPMNDATGKMSTNYLDFTITGTVTTEALMYELEVANSNANINNYLKLYLTNQQNEAIAGPFLYSELYDALVQNRKGIHQDMMEVNLDGTSKTITRNYRLRMWIDESIPDTSGVTATVSVYLYAKNTNNTKSHLASLNVGDDRNIKKVVVEGETYGSLPTPTRNDYTFLGWNGKNKAYDITDSKYNFYHFQSRTSGEFGIENEFNYAKINGNNSSSNIDTSWRIDSKYYIEFYNQGNYTLSFWIKSNNSLLTQFINKRNGTSDGKTGIYYNGSVLDNDLIATINQNINFENNGEWHRVSEIIAIPNDNTTGKLIIGNDTPNIYGAGSYISIANIQLEEGSVVTEYEPYFVTSDVEVTEWNTDMVLKAIWQENS